MEIVQPGSPELFLDVPFSKRWDCHRNTIQRLYIDEDRSIEDVLDIMKHTYRFDANVRQYKYHLNKWKISKSVSSNIKYRALQILGKRIRDGRPVEGIRFNGVEIDKKKLRRYIKGNAPLNEEFKLTSSVFYHWNLPYRASTTILDHGSPGASNFSTPSNFSVFSPPVVRDQPTPGNAASPANAPTPTTKAISHFDRSKLFIQGDMKKFMKGMSPSDRRMATTWLHQFWLFAFTTTKHWGKGPQKWTAGMLRMTELSEQISLPGTPAAWGLENEYTSPADISETSRNSAYHNRLPQPSSLCRWYIHVNEDYYDRIPSPPNEEVPEYDIQDSDSWPQWTQEPCTVAERLQDALEDNSFSNINTQELPLSTNAIAIAAATSPEAMSVEAMSFAIMARNRDLVFDLVSEARKKDLDVSIIYPYHLAASYLDGSSACCDIFDELLILSKQNLVNRLYVNDLGHTVLDSLMLTVLKGHTSCTPNMIDERMKTMARFPGEDIDVCGRWDADSPCLRALNTDGTLRIPFEWKHMFCHTSVQAICHSIARLFSRRHALDINIPSGLFTKSCFTCGSRLVIGPLHTLVLTAFNLAQKGCEGETLFGMVACLTCLLVNGADPTAKADLSVDLLLGIDEQQGCSHALLDPLELGEKVPLEVCNSWSADTKLGWDSFMAVLAFAQRRIARIATRASRLSDGIHLDFDDREAPLFAENDLYSDAYGSDIEYLDESDDETDCIDHNIGDGRCCGSRHLNTLWSAIQTELVSYRRLQDGEPWISDNFNLTAVRDGANASEGFSHLPLLEKQMMTPVCKCGRLFTQSFFANIATTDEACSYYFSNMDDWQRSKYAVFYPDC